MSELLVHPGPEQYHTSVKTDFRASFSKIIAERRKNGTIAEHDPVLPEVVMRTENLSAGYDKKAMIEAINLDFGYGVTSIMGPSGCGKSTLLWALNTMLLTKRPSENAAGVKIGGSGWVSGSVYLDGENIYAAGIDPRQVRERVGLVFQKPNPFPLMDIVDNVTIGLQLQGKFKRPGERVAKAEELLTRVGLWDEVKDKLGKSGASLSGGQQQRLCIARAIASEPRVLLMDEPCSALDPIATFKIEELMLNLSRDIVNPTPIILVTHNIPQAARVSNMVAFMLTENGKPPGKIIEHTPVSEFFTKPKDQRADAYLTGRFG